ncbi:hypothetical protein [Anoxybacter fermentans]|uniref:hypothetical protein n=1 Tax=Anoxybacter fermentans TaxID=1323375 RepID=UPI001F34FD94|nr:hypothetical protein [Anoxybacter fermentans]
MRKKRKITEPVVAIISNPYEGDALVEALNLLPLENLVQSEETVVKNQFPENSVVVGTETFRQLIRYFKGKIPGHLVIAADSGGASTPQVFEQVGYKTVIEEEVV